MGLGAPFPFMDELESHIQAINEVVFADRAREKAAIRARQPLIAKELRDRGSAWMDGIGQHMARIDSRVYWRWEQQYPGFWRDKANVDKFLKDNPCYCAPGYRPTATP